MSLFLRDLAAELPAALFTRVPPTPVPEPGWLAFNPDAAALLRLDSEQAQTPELLALLAGNALPAAASPIATVYGGHQFGIWAGQLGDGRAILLGSVQNAGGESWEVQLKGAGPTPYSRHADGRAVLRSSIREYLCSEAMHGLGIPTTRALAIVGSPLAVRRESIESAAILTRLAPSHIRFGHFEWLDYTERPELLRQLADLVISQHFAASKTAASPYAAWLTEVVQRTARLMAAWQCVGFCHGVMNTDNFSILGLTIDYGPFGFIDGFDAGHICNHSDDAGRYAYDQQPQVGHWNCGRLLSACLPLLAESHEAGVEIATSILDSYAPTYAATAIAGWRAKLGLVTAQDEDSTLINRWLTLLHRTRGDFTLSFRRLSTLNSESDAADEGRDYIADPVSYDAWIDDYRARLRAEASIDAERAPRMNAVNPLYLLRNHHAQWVIEQAEAGAPEHIERLRRVLATPFTEQAEAAMWAEPPPPGLDAPAVSCSS